MSSDAIKDFLISRFPGSTAAQWKRRSKGKVAEGILRTFENTSTGDRIDTIEAADGAISVRGEVQTGEPGRADAKPLFDADLAKKVTETGQKVLADIVEATPEVAEANIDGVLVKVERNQMVPGSKWVFTREVVLDLWVSNPARDALIQQRYPSGGWARDPQIAAMDERVVAHVATIPAGTEITIIGKSISENTYSSTPAKFSNGLMFPVRLADNHGVTFVIPIGNWRSTSPLQLWNGEGPNECQLPFKRIADAIQPLEIPYTPIFVLRDSATGQLFGGWQTTRETHNYGYGPVESVRSDVGNPKMVTKLSSAKKYSTSSACKASIREFTGYNVGLEEGADGGAYYIMGGEKAMDLPPTWEMVEFNKVTGEEKRVIDVQNWLKSLNRLRVLTTTHGSAARAAYKKAEGKDFEAIIVFQNRSVGSTTYANGARVNWDEKAAFDEYRDGPRAIRAIDAAAKMMSGKTLKAKSPSAFAYACSFSDAFAASLAFDFSGRDDNEITVTILDMNTLEEVVREPIIA